MNRELLEAVSNITITHMSVGNTARIVSRKQKHKEEKCSRLVHLCMARLIGTLGSERSNQTFCPEQRNRRL